MHGILFDRFNYTSPVDPQIADDLRHPIRREMLLADVSTRLTDSDKILIGLDWIGVILQAANSDPKKSFKPQRLYDVIKNVQDQKNGKSKGRYSFESTVIDGERVTVKVSY